MLNETLHFTRLPVFSFLFYNDAGKFWLLPQFAGFSKTHQNSLKSRIFEKGKEKRKTYIGFLFSKLDYRDFTVKIRLCVKG